MLRWLNNWMRGRLPYKRVVCKVEEKYFRTPTITLSFNHSSKISIRFFGFQANGGFVYKDKESIQIGWDQIEGILYFLRYVKTGKLSLNRWTRITRIGDSDIFCIRYKLGERAARYMSFNSKELSDLLTIYKLHLQDFKYSNFAYGRGLWDPNKLKNEILKNKRINNDKVRSATKNITFYFT